MLLPFANTIEVSARSVKLDRNFLKIFSGFFRGQKRGGRGVF